MSGKRKRVYVPYANRDWGAIKKFYESGSTVKELAQLEHMSMSYVVRGLRSLKTQMRHGGRLPHSMPTKKQQKILRMIQEGMSFAEAARRGGIWRQDVYRLVKRWPNWTKRRGNT